MPEETALERAKRQFDATSGAMSRVAARVAEGAVALDRYIEHGGPPPGSGLGSGFHSGFSKKSKSSDNSDAPLLNREYTVSLARNDRGLGLVFDSLFYVTKMLPGCAARESGEISIGDRLLAVDGVELQPGDGIAAYFPFGDQAFELRFMAKAKQEDKSKRSRRVRKERFHKEPSGKYLPTRSGPVFEEVQWNEYCVLFPDGTSRPFNEDVRYTSLTGYLRKRKVVKDGRADFVLLHGESSRGWVRHFIHLSIQKLAWFDEDPQKEVSKLDALKTFFSKGKVGARRPTADPHPPRPTTPIPHDHPHPPRPPPPSKRRQPSLPV